MKRIEQFDKYMKYKGLNDNKVTQQLGLSTGTIGKSRKENRDLSDKVVELILNFYTDLSRSWLLAGDGEMLTRNNVSQTITTNNGLAVANNGGNINYHPTNHDANEAGEVEEIPVIPRYIYEETDVDAFEYINENDVPTSPKVKQFPNFDAYVNVYSDEMTPEINKGDKIAITPYEIGMERKVIDGRAYIIDTKYNGMMLRKLYKEDNGFRAESTNPAYRTEFIEYDEVIRVFRIVGLIRTNI